MQGRDATEFSAKKKEMKFRDKKWPDFRGSFYRNMVEFSFIADEFDATPSDIILEVGAGSGRFTEKMAEIGAKVIALDMSREQLRINRERCCCDVVLGDLCHLPFKSCVFDKTVALSVFQCVPTEKSRLSGLKEAKRVTRKGGIFLIDVYNHRPLLDFWVNRKEGFYRTSPPVYYYRFGFREFQIWLGSMFRKILSFKGILVLYPLMKASKLENSPVASRIALLLERGIRKTFLPSFFGDFILATCEA